MTKRRHLHLSGDRAASADGLEALVQAAAGGDAQAMERLLMRAQEVAYRFSLLVCGHAEDAEDVMQEALLKTYRHVDRLEHPEAFRTWLYRTVTNACRMKRRRRVHEPARLLSIEAGQPDGAGGHTAIDVAAPGGSPHDLATQAWLGRRLRRAIGGLPPAYRWILLLREIEGLSTRDVATVTGLSEDNVKTRLHRARVMLREALGPR